MNRARCLLSAFNELCENISVDEKTVRRSRFDWQLPFYAAVGALILYAPFMIYGIDILEILYIFVAAPIIGVIMLVVAIRKKGPRRLAILSMLIVYCAVSWGLFENSRNCATLPDGSFGQKVTKLRFWHSRIPQMEL